jgi:divinyl protochlorophyllide a 8-vinyl-reductase
MLFEIADNPVVRGETAATPVCHWHSAVFAGLFAALVDPHTQVIETACCACGAPACRFEVRW